MEELILLSTQEPGLVKINNFIELKQALTEILARYQNVIYTEDMLAEAKADKRELTRLRKELDDRRKEIKRVYLAPYNDFEAQIKELIAMVDSPLGEIKAMVTAAEDREKEKRRGEIESFFLRKSGSLGTTAQQVWNSPAFFDSKWLNKSTSAKTWQTAVESKIASAAQGLNIIRDTGGQYTVALTERYLETLSTEGLAEYRDKLHAVQAIDVHQEEVPQEDQRIGYKVLKLMGNEAQIAHALDFLELVGIEYEELEDGMPQPMLELTEPSFDSFVCFDIETTGTFGAANGDAPAEITEIGAVKVINGVIVDRQDWLCNPGRRIVPRVARLTNISDAMLSDKPPIEAVIRDFAQFVGELPLVGHNIKSSDLYYINRALGKAGVRLESAFFDTYCYAKKFKTTYNWANTKLEYLSQQFGISQPDAHRAWCDAEANAGVYLKLKSLLFD